MSKSGRAKEQKDKHKKSEKRHRDNEVKEKMEREKDVVEKKPRDKEVVEEKFVIGEPNSTSKEVVNQEYHLQEMMKKENEKTEKEKEYYSQELRKKQLEMEEVLLRFEKREKELLQLVEDYKVQVHERDEKIKVLEEKNISVVMQKMIQIHQQMRYHLLHLI